MAKLPEWLEEQLRRQEEERRRMIQRRYEPIKAEAPPLIPPVKRHSSNPVPTALTPAGMEREALEYLERQIQDEEQSAANYYIAAAKLEGAGRKEDAETLRRIGRQEEEHAMRLRVMVYPP